MSQAVQLPSVSNASQNSEGSNREQINENIGQAVPFVDNPRNSGGLLQKIKKGFILVLLSALLIWMVSYLLSDAYLKSRVPESLSISKFFNRRQIISPAENDYRSFKFFKKFQELAKISQQQGRELNPEQIKQLQNIEFKEFYDLYKVARTIQLAKQYSINKEEQEFNYEFKQGVNIEQSVNMTEYFNDAVNQFSCGSCYSFPIAATIQFLYKYKYNITVKLSEQQLIDCSKDDPEANGCEDGNLTKGFEYVQNKGLLSSDDYPYQSVQGKSFTCKQQLIENQNITKYKISGFKILPKGDCKSIKEQLVNNNTVATMINAENFGIYKIGETFSDCKRVDLNHAVTIVGQTQKSQWIVRNSWGKSWGTKGYLNLGRGNTCGVCSHAIVPILVIENQKVLTMEEIEKPIDSKN